MRAREKQFVAEWNSDRRSSFPLHRSNFGDSNRVVVGRLDPRAPPPTCLEITHEPGASIVRKNAAALQYRLSSAGLDSFQACVNLTSIKSTTP
jgi:hypothetical protein